MRARTVTAVAKADCRESTRGGEGCVQVAVTRRPCSVERWHAIATAWRGAYTEAMQCDSPTASAQKEEEGGGCSQPNKLEHRRGLKIIAGEYG